MTDGDVWTMVHQGIKGTKKTTSQLVTLGNNGDEGRLLAKTRIEAVACT